QIDFYSPKKFDLHFTNANGEKEHPVIIHRAIMGSFDRFFAFLIEKHAGAFPLWLCPIQVKVLSVGESHKEFCCQLADIFKAKDIRVTIDQSAETVGKKIRKAVNEKLPYMLVIGDKEMNSKDLSVRDRGSNEMREININDLIQEIKDKVEKKS
ncbi:MAG: His/Gly/Thr/Pro-type tRNA ligase C-terminal domain-containing protein, partial [Candidatus Falkowbacteria bacterium]|nr:His/Gly/Thr/Pro-type tRNA ligase C-terminal domain-containing protein [Candidatus Falkowbacteria bacterium]